MDRVDPYRAVNRRECFKRPASHREQVPHLRNRIGVIWIEVERALKVMFSRVEPTRIDQSLGEYAMAAW